MGNCYIADLDNLSSLRYDTELNEQLKLERNMTAFESTRIPNCMVSNVLSMVFCLSLTPVTGYSGEKVEAVTVFIEKHHTTTRDGLVDKANKSHEKMGAEGWEFQSLEVYDEDGDLRGFFVTYTRGGK